MPSTKPAKMGFLVNMHYEMVDELLLTVGGRDRLVSQLEYVAKALYTKQGAASLADLSEEVQNGLSLYLKKNKIDTKKSADVQKAFLNLADHLKKLPTITLVLAFEPTITQIKKFAAKIELYGTRPLLNIRTDEKVLAGAILENNGRAKDYSIKTTNV